MELTRTFSLYPRWTCARVSQSRGDRSAVPAVVQQRCGLLAEEHRGSHGGEHEAEEAGDIFRLSGGHEPIDL
jgi:hypothetical protein